MTTPQPPQYSIRAFQDNGTPYDNGILPSWSTFTLTTIFNNGGVLEFEYAVNGENLQHLVPTRRLAVFVDGFGEIAETRMIIDDINGYRVMKDGVLYQKFTAHSLWTILDEMIVRLTGSYNKPLTDGRVLKQKTCGQILNLIWADMATQNQLQFITKDWTGIADSNGNSWTSDLIDTTIPWGWTFRQVVTWLIERGDIDVRFEGDTLRIFNASGLRANRPTVVIWAGESTQELPEETNTENIWTALLIKGKENRMWYYEDAGSLATYRRKTAVLSEDNVETTARADKMATRFFNKNNAPAVTRNIKYTASGVAPKPFQNYDCGDNIGIDLGGSVIMHSVAQMDLTVSAGADDQNGEVTLTLGRRWKTTGQVNKDAVTSVTVNGAGSVSGGAPYVPLFPPHDPLGPGAATAPLVTSNTVQYSATDTFAEFVLGWAPVTVDANGDATSQIDHYEINWKYTSDTDWQYPIKTRDLTVTVTPAKLNTSVTCNVRAVDFWSNAGAASVNTVFTTANDTTPPPVPSAPTLTTRLGTVTVSWDGTFVAAAPRPIDMDHVEVHRSTTSGFTPSTSTLAGQITDKTFLVFSDLGYNVPIYVKLIAVDRVGNKSAASTQASATTQPLVNTDIIGQVVNGANIVDGTIVASDKVVANSITATQIAANTITAGQIAANTITADRMVTGTITAVSAILASASVVNATIANLAVTDAKINDLTATKITAGTISASITISGRFATSLTGARAEMNSTGFHAFNASAVETFTADTSGAVQMLGTFKNAASGARIEIPAGSASVNLYSGAATETTPGRLFNVDVGGYGEFHLESPRYTAATNPAYLSIYSGSGGSPGGVVIQGVSGFSSTAYLGVAGDINGYGIEAQSWLYTPGSVTADTDVSAGSQSYAAQFRGGSQAGSNTVLTGNHLYQRTGGTNGGTLNLNVVTGGVVSIGINGSATTMNTSALNYPNYPTAGTANMSMTAGGLIQRISSSRRYKENIRDLDIDVDKAIQLRPRMFQRNDRTDILKFTDEDGMESYEHVWYPVEDSPWEAGFVAEEAEELGLTQWVEYHHETGEVDGFFYMNWIAAQQAVLRAHASRIAELESLVAAIGAS